MGDHDGRRRPRQRARRSLKELHFPHSLGLLYSAFTYYTGFKVNSGEYKVMGLAPYGEPKYAQTDPRQPHRPQAGRHRSGSTIDYFDYCTGLTHDERAVRTSCSARPPRKPEELLTQRHMDLAASIQAVTEEVVLRLTRSLARETGPTNLCLAGGVALNCVANGKVLRDGASSASGSSRRRAMPAARSAPRSPPTIIYAGRRARALRRLGRRHARRAISGPAFDQTDIESDLAAAGARFDGARPTTS